MLPDVRKKTAALLVAAVFLLCGCGKAYAFVIRKDTIKVQIINATDSSNGVLVKTVDCVTDENKITEGKHLITRAQFDRIYSYIESIKNPDFLDKKEDNYTLYSQAYEDHTYLGRIKVTCVSELNGLDHQAHDVVRTVDIFDEYPEGFDEFIKLINEIEPEEPVMTGKPLTMSAELYKKLTGYTDDMVTDGTVEDVLRVYPVDLYHLMTRYADHSLNYSIRQDIPVRQVFRYWPLFRSLPVKIKMQQSMISPIKISTRLFHFLSRIRSHMRRRTRKAAREAVQSSEQPQVRKQVISGRIIFLLRREALSDAFHTRAVVRTHMDTPKP